MKAKLLLVILVVSIIAVPVIVLSAEGTFDPSTQYYDINSEGVLNLWGISGTYDNAVKANPDNGWPSEFAIAAWYATILKAHEMNLYVVVGYDPVTFDIWYIAKPR